MIDNEKDEAIREVLNMSKSELELLDSETFKLECCVEGCTKYWNVKDFGVSPHFYIRGKFYNLRANYSCGYHFKHEKDFPLKDGLSIGRLTKKE